jgi:hypothetical protein
VISTDRSLRSLLDHRGGGVISTDRSLRSLLDHRGWRGDLD